MFLNIIFIIFIIYIISFLKAIHFFDYFINIINKARNFIEIKKQIYRPFLIIFIICYISIRNQSWIWRQ